MGSNVPPMTPSRIPIGRNPTAGSSCDRSGAQPSYQVAQVLRVVQRRGFLEPLTCLGRHLDEPGEGFVSDHAGGCELDADGRQVERPRQRVPRAVALLDAIAFDDVGTRADPLQLSSRLREPRPDVEHHVLRGPPLVGYPRFLDPIGRDPSEDRAELGPTAFLVAEQPLGLGDHRSSTRSGASGTYAKTRPRISTSSPSEAPAASSDRNTPSRRRFRWSVASWPSSSRSVPSTQRS